MFAADEVPAAGCGSLTLGPGIAGLARSTIDCGKDDLEEEPLLEGRVRCKDGSGKPLAERDPTLAPNLQRHFEPATMGDPVRVKVHDFEDNRLVL